VGFVIKSKKKIIPTFYKYIPSRHEFQCLRHCIDASGMLEFVHVVLVILVYQKIVMFKRSQRRKLKE